MEPEKVDVNAKVMAMIEEFSSSNFYATELQDQAANNLSYPLKEMMEKHGEEIVTAAIHKAYETAKDYEDMHRSPFPTAADLLEELRGLYEHPKLSTEERTNDDEDLGPLMPKKEPQ